MSTTTSSHRLPPKPLDLEITIISAKHLKNVNWRNGDLTPYVIFWLDPDRRLATKSDDSNSTKPVWNERFLIPFPSSSPKPVLTLEIFHSKPLDTPKPLVGTLRVPIEDLPNPDDLSVVRTFDLRRPSGRVNGKIRLKVGVRDRPVPDYQIPLQPSYYYTSAPPPPPPSNYSRYPPSIYNNNINNNTPPSLPPPPPPAAPLAPSPPPPASYHYASAYTDPYSGYYQGGLGVGYYSQPLPSQTPRPHGERPPPTYYGGGGVAYSESASSYGGGGGLGYVESQSGYGGGGGGSGPSAPVDHAHYEQKKKAGKVGSVSGMEVGVGAVAGGVAGLAIDEGLRYQDEKGMERVESELNARELDDYSGYRRADY